MNHRMIWKAAIVLLCAAGLLMAQRNKGKQKQGEQTPPPTPAAEAQGSPVAKQPTVKSQKEAEAVQAIFAAKDPDSRIKAANDLVENFADSEFKPLALFFAMVSYQQKNDYENTIVYGERCLQADPQNYQAMLIMGQTIAARTREFDLDREEKLKTAEGYADKALEILKTAPRPNPNVSDQQWEEVKQDLTAQAVEIHALAALARNQPDKAVEEFKKVIAATPNPDPSTMVRLAGAYNKAGKYDDGIAVLDKVLAAPDLNPMIKQVAQAERQRAVQAKSKGAPPEQPAPAKP